MIKPEMIPPEAVEAAARALAADANLHWNDIPYVHTILRNEALAAIAAALNAWPALEICYFLPQGRTITLPFPNVSKYPRKEGDK